MQSKSSPFRFALVLLCLGGVALGASAAVADHGFVLRQGVVADLEANPGAATLYVMTPDGPIVALDAPSGNEKWAGPHGEPLGLYGDRLVALAEPTAPRQAEIFFLSTQTGAIEATVRFELPAGTSVLIDDLPHRRFTATTAFAGDDVYLHWSFVGRPLRGALLEGSGNETVELSGVVRLDPASGNAQEVESTNAPSPGPFIPDLSEAERLPQLDGRQFRSADDRIVLASRKVADARQWERYAWTFTDRDTGERLGDLRSSNSMAPFVVASDTLVYVAQPYARRLPSGEFETQRLRLEAVDLRSGSSLWSADLRDTTFRGVLPP